MYAYGKVMLEHANVRALPVAAVVEIGNQNCCFLYEDGKAVKTPVQTGISDGKWVAVLKKRTSDGWAVLTGNEKVILGNLSELSDGQPVQVVGTSSEKH